MTNPAPATPPAGSTEPATGGSLPPDSGIAITEASARAAVDAITALAASARELADETTTAAAAASAATVTGPDDTASAAGLLTSIAGEIGATLSEAAGDAGTAAASVAATAAATAALLDRELGIAADAGTAIGAVGGPA